MEASEIGGAAETRRRQLRAYRTLAVTAALLFVGFGVVHGLVNPARVDPPAERVGMALLMLLLAKLTYHRPARWLRWVARVVLYATTLWMVQLVWLNDFAADYAMSLLVAVPVIAATYRSLGGLLPYLVVTNGAVVGASMLAAAPRLNPWLLSADMAGISLLSLILARSSWRTEAELATSRERYELAAHGASDGLWDWNLATGSVYYSPRWKSMLGFAAGEVGESLGDWLDRVHGEDAEGLRAALQAHLSGSTPQFQREYRIHDAAGEWRWMLARGLTLRDAEGKPIRMAGSQTDIGAWKRAEARLLHDALHDALTDLPNRALFLDRLERSSQPKRHGATRRCAVLFLDLDRFKLVNDGLGHPVGDELLRIVARRLLRCVRQEDTVARLGGDEFGILLTDIRQVSDATRMAQRVNAALQQPVRIGEHEVFTSASIGVALFTPGYERPEDVLRDADTAMYRAKAAGGMCHEAQPGAMQTRAAERLRLEHELRRAVERGEMRVQYQPIVELDGGSLVGFEALLRWQHPGHGLLMPDDFIPLAEETGIILALDWWVLYRACEQVARWAPALTGQPACGTGDEVSRIRRGLAISINLSGKHFWQEDLVRRLDRVLAETGARPQHLQLEITESAVMRDANAAAAVMAQVRGRGISLAIDDFGTGNSSLNHLQRFPVDALKIDRGFIARLGKDARSAEMVRSIVALARILDLHAVAEGIETTQQADELRRLGCELAQGFLYAQPLDADAAGHLLSTMPAAAAALS